MSVLARFALTAAGPGVVAAIGLAISAAFNPLVSATYLGMGVGGLFSPATLIGTIATAIAAQKWWHAIVRVGIGYAVSRAFFIRPVDSFDASTVYELNSAIGSLVVGCIIVAVAAAVKMLFQRKQAVSE